MTRNFALFICALILAIACSSPKSEAEKQITTSNEWELQIVDSIQVDYLADVREGTFNDGIGIIKDIMSTTLVKFDTTGKILAKKVHKICVAYDDLERFFPKEKLIKTGNPIREDLLQIDSKTAEAKKVFEKKTSK